MKLSTILCLGLFFFCSYYACNHKKLGKENTKPITTEDCWKKENPPSKSMRSAPNEKGEVTFYHEGTNYGTYRIKKNNFFEWEKKVPCNNVQEDLETRF
jgi:hypothetical protein